MSPETAADAAVTGMRRLDYGPQPEQFAQLWSPAASAPLHDAHRPLLMLVHGGYWRSRHDLAHMEPMAAALARDGWPVLNVEYRRIPGNPQAMLDDLQSALRTLPARVGVPAGRVLLVGFSAGGQLALWLAAQAGAPLLAVLALAPVADLQRARALHLSDDAVDQWLGGATAPLQRWDPCLLPPPAVPVTLVHGEADRDVPVELSRRYAARHPQARLECLPLVDHFALIEPGSAAWSTVHAALLRSAASLP
jgi:acetyl esterase/lipase